MMAPSTAGLMCGQSPSALVTVTKSSPETRRRRRATAKSRAASGESAAFSGERKFHVSTEHHAAREELKGGGDWAYASVWMNMGFSGVAGSRPARGCALTDGAARRTVKGRRDQIEDVDRALAIGGDMGRMELMARTRGWRGRGGRAGPAGRGALTSTTVVRRRRRSAIATEGATVKASRACRPQPLPELAAAARSKAPPQPTGPVACATCVPNRAAHERPAPADCRAPCRRAWCGSAHR